MPKMVSDHNPVSLTLQTNRNPKGPGYWKFPNALLSNQTFTKQLKTKIKSVVDIHKCGTDPALLWDTVKCATCSFTMDFLRADGLLDK